MFEQPVFEPCWASDLPRESYCALCASESPPQSQAPEQANEEVVEIEETPEKMPISPEVQQEVQQRMIKSLERKLVGANAELAQFRKEETSRKLSISFSVVFVPMLSDSSRACFLLC